jgi:hypothetical protein
MALRLLMYVARVYEKIIDPKKMYSDSLIPIPRPEFFVLYNGTAPFPDGKVYRLSDSFEGLGSLGLSEHERITLELEVRVLNINEGRNADIVHRCRKLAEYSAFVAKVREFEKELGDREEAIKAAIRYCLRCDILKELLEKHAAEVISMLMAEWNAADAIAVARAEGLEKGLEKGQEKIARNLLAMGMPVEEIARAAELPLERVRAIAQAPR